LVRRQPQVRYGIAELFGFQIDRISKKERDSLLKYSLSSSIANYPVCPFRLPDKKGNRSCTKQGGVCSIRRYINDDGLLDRLPGSEGTLTVTCPNRFHEDMEIFRWVGEQVLEIQDIKDLILTKEVFFLENPNQNNQAAIDDDAEKTSENVGRIDLILLDRRSLSTDYLRWCALEIQAVYFSGKGMKSQFKSILEYDDDTIPFPNATRRPDYRSSGPKRLMPQLQIKIPSLRRWGKKMAVVVDNHFFDWIGYMEKVRDISNSDIIWFVVGFDEQGIRAKLRRDRIIYTTLERAIDGLTGGIPVALRIFEDRIRENVSKEEQNERNTGKLSFISD